MKKVREKVSRGPETNKWEETAADTGRKREARNENADMGILLPPSLEQLSQQNLLAALALAVRQGKNQTSGTVCWILVWKVKFRCTENVSCQVVWLSAPPYSQ